MTTQAYATNSNQFEIHNQKQRPDTSNQQYSPREETRNAKPKILDKKKNTNPTIDNQNQSTRNNHPEAATQK